METHGFNDVSGLAVCHPSFNLPVIETAKSNQFYSQYTFSTFSTLFCYCFGIVVVWVKFQNVPL